MKRTFINKVILSPADRNCSGSQPCKKRDPEQRHLRMTGTMSSRSVFMRDIRSFLLRPILRIETLRNDGAAGVRGFTLVELLVVVLIIGILSAIAIPMYQGAVDKSHWSTMLPASKAIKDAEEAFKMTNGEYSNTMEHLDVQISNDDLTFTLNTPNNLADSNVIRVTNSKLGNNVRLASYLDDSPKFAGQLHCEANDGESGRGTRLCSKLLNGTELSKTEDNYMAYLLDQSITQAICNDAQLVWSNKQTHCYKTEKDRCEANGMPYNNSSQLCGYSHTSGTEDDKLVIEEGAMCVGDRHYASNNCLNLKVESGGMCKAVSNLACRDSQYAPGSSCKEFPSMSCDGCCGGNNTFDGATCTAGGCSGTFINGSICNSTRAHACSGEYHTGSICNGDAQYSCHGATFYEGSKCVANQPNTCGAIYGDVTYDGGCCEGPYCPSWVPHC